MATSECYLGPFRKAQPWKNKEMDGKAKVVIDDLAICFRWRGKGRVLVGQSFK